MLKASGLAAGKGVLIPETTDEAVAAVDTILVEKKFGAASLPLVVEECIEGEEVSVLAFTDGYTGKC